ncbi:MAG: T9SS type A sorting domain-containing protein, partial [Bacteroidetes bacterium]|nr:T9SS type A sorting domain-containing protein [Bacteroidota bacterium]
ATNTAAVEFVVTSVTSPGLDVIEAALGQLPQWLLNLFGGAVPAVVQSFNPHMEYVNIEDHGYMVLTVNQNRAQGDYVWLEREVIDQTDEAGPSYYTNNGVSNMTESNSAIAPLQGPPVPPASANQNMAFALLLDTFVVNASENVFNSSCLLNVSSLCPNITTSIIENPEFGSANINQFCWDYQGINNYYGEDYFTLTFCQTLNPSDCDTVVVQVNIAPDRDIDTLSYTITSDSVLNNCVVFDDLAAWEDTLYANNIGSGSLLLSNPNCFTYTPDSSFNGNDYLMLIACDSLNICDTVVLNIEVAGTNFTTYVELYGYSGDLLSNCLGFDDLQGAIVNTGMIYNGTNGAQQFGDTCLSYISDLNFTGLDTVTLFACDNSQPPICDTIVYWVFVLGDSIPDTTGIRTIQNTDFAVMGVYPNPFDIEILVQYYQFSSEKITIALYDVAGKEIFKENINESSTGLKYARLETSELARGSYVVELSSSKFSYTQKIIKY